MDTNVATPQYDVPLWNETRWNGCWNPEAGVGLYLHLGRYRHDLDLWWCQVVVYLPDGELVVDRFFAPNTGVAGATMGNLDLQITDEGWTARYDGAGQLTTTAAMAQAAQGSSAPIRRLTFEVTAVAAQPEWDMQGGRREQVEFADTHVQGSYRTTGSVSVAGTVYPLDGVGFKDHSSGPRSFEGWYGHRFLVIVGPDYSCHAIGLYATDGSLAQVVGALIRDGVQSRVTVCDLPELEDAAGGPVHGPLVIETEAGERLEFDSELVHAAPMLITLDNDYVNGVDWDMAGDPIVLIEGKGKLTAADGSVVYCFHERSALRSRVTRPAQPGAVPRPS